MRAHSSQRLRARINLLRRDIVADRSLHKYQLFSPKWAYTKIFAHTDYKKLEGSFNANSILKGKVESTITVLLDWSFNGTAFGRSMSTSKDSRRSNDDAIVSEMGGMG